MGRRLGVGRGLSLAVGALICGFFWEMWNFWSMAKWVYAVPFVQKFHIFEMPILGYAGYLPFGLECAIIAERVARCGGMGSTVALPYSPESEDTTCRADQVDPTDQVTR